MDIATLGVNIKYDSVKQAGAALDKFSQAGEKAEKATEKFTQSTASAAKATDTLKNALIGLSFGAVAASALKAAESYTALQSQIRLVTETAREAITVQSKLSQISNATYSEVGATVKLFSAMEPTMGAMGKTFNESSRFIETFQKALALTSPTATESASAIQQFVQAMGSGVLRGEEFNTIMENGRGVAMALAEGLGLPLGKLRSLAEEGKLTADVVVSALESQADVIDTKFGKMTMTVGQAWQVLRNETVNTVGSLDKAIGVTENLAKAINDFALGLGSTTTYINSYAEAASFADTSTRDLLGAVVDLINIDTDSWLTSIAIETHKVAQAFKAVAYDIDLVGQIIGVSLGGEFGLIKDVWAEYQKNMDRLGQEHEVFEKRLRNNIEALKDTRSQIEMLLDQERGLGGQLEILNEQNRAFGISIDATAKSLSVYSAVTRESNELSKGGAKIIGALQEEYALLSLSTRDAAIAKAQFKAINEGASKDELSYIKEITGQIFDANSAKKQLETTTKTYTKTLKDQSKAHLEAIEALDKQVEAISKAEQSFRKYLNGSDFTAQVDELNEVTKAWKVLADNGLATTEDLQKAIDAVTMERFGAESQKAAEKMVENIDYAAEAMKASIKRLDDAFADVWVDIFNGAEDFGSSLQRWFTSLLAELAHAAITKPIVISMSGAMGMGSSGIASASGGLDIVGNIGNIFSSSSNIIGTVAGTAGTYLGAMGAGAGSAQAAMLAGQSGAFGMQGAALTTQALGASGLSSAMSAMASAAPYIAAALVIDQLTGGAISTGVMGSSRGERTRALNIGIANGQVSDASNIYRATHYDAGWGRSGSWNVDNLGGAEFNNTIKATVNAMASSIRDNSERLGFEFNEGFSGSFDADLFGKTAEETQQIIADTFVRIGQSMVDSVSGLSDAMTPLQQSGEQTYETLARVVGQFDAFNYPIGRLNDTLATLNMTTLGAVDSLVAMSGGIQNLQALQSSFINAFYTDSQKAELTAQTVSSIFESIGMSAPASREALVSMVQALDLTTESGQRAYVALTGAAATLDTFFSNLEQQAQEADRAYEVALGNLSSAVNAEKSRLQDALNDEIKALQDAHNDRVRLLQDEADTISRNLSKLKSFQSSLKSIIDTLIPKYSGAGALRDATSDIMGYVSRGIIPEQEAVQQALDVVKTQDKTYYSTYEEYVLDQAQANVAANELLALIDSGVAKQEATLQTVTDQIANEGLVLAQAMANAQATYELELARLDSILESYGILNDSVLSVRDAVNALGGSLAAKAAAAQSNPHVGSVPSNAAPGVNSAYAHSSGVNVSASDSATLAAAKLVYQSATGGVSTAQFNSASAAVGGDIYAATGWNGDPASFRAMWGFEVGGYTGDMATDAIAGVVHGQEYVVNAKTTRDLGLNNQGGVFIQMANELMLLRQEVADLKAQDRQIGVQLIKQTRTTADTLDKWDSVGMPA